MPLLRSNTALFALAFGLVACWDRDSATISGVVLRGPMCPVESEGSPCPDQPYAGVEVEAAFERDMVADSDVTDADGRFELSVDGGVPYRVYVLVEPIEHAEASRVRVDAGETLELTLRVDSGIR